MEAQTPGSGAASTASGSAAPSGAPASSSTGAGTTSTGTPTPAAVTTPTRSTTAVDALKRAAAAAESSAATSTGQAAPIGVPTTGAQVPASQVDDGSADAEWLAIPEQRRMRILQNNEKKTRDAVTAELMKQFGWAKEYQREHVEIAVGNAVRLAQNPVQFLRQLEAEIKSDPQLARLLTQPGDVVGDGQGGKPTPKQFKLPQGKLVAQDGTRAYSEDQVQEALTSFEEYLESKFGERISPVEQFAESFQEREEVAEIVQQSRQEAGQVVSEMEEHFPYFKENKKLIGQVYAKVNPDFKQRHGVVAALQLAYNLVMKEHVLPKLSQTSQQQVRDEMATKAAAGSGTVVPGAASPNQKAARPRNKEELARHMEKLSQGAR
jgi:hypothetical protein